MRQCAVPDLLRALDDREGDHQGGEKGDFDLDEEGLENVGVDQPPLAGGKQRRRSGA